MFAVEGREWLSDDLVCKHREPIHLYPVPKVLEATSRAFCVLAVVDGLQLSQGGRRVGPECLVARGLRVLCISAILFFYSAMTTTTHRSGNGRSSLQARRNRCVLEPLREVALGFKPALLCALLIEAVVDGLQLGQGRDGIRSA